MGGNNYYQRIPLTLQKIHVQGTSLSTAGDIPKEILTLPLLKLLEMDDGNMGLFAAEALTGQ